MNQQQLKVISNGLEKLSEFHKNEAKMAERERLADRSSRSFEKEKHEILSLLFEGLHGCFYNASRITD